MKHRNWFWGSFLIVAAAVFILYQLEVFSGVEGVSAWMLLLGVLLLAVLVQSVISRSFTGLLFSAALLCIVFSSPLGLGAITPWPVLIAAALGSVGLNILFGGRSKKKKWEKEYAGHHGLTEAEIENIGDNVTECRTRFGGSSKYLHADSLEYVNVSCHFGGMEIYLNDCKLSPKGAVMEFDCSFGGVEMFVPSDWRVVSKLSVVIGGIDGGEHNLSSDGPTLTLTGRVSVGGLEINYI